MSLVEFHNLEQNNLKKKEKKLTKVKIIKSENEKLMTVIFFKSVSNEVNESQFQFKKTQAFILIGTKLKTCC